MSLWCNQVVWKHFCCEGNGSSLKVTIMKIASYVQVSTVITVLNLAGKQITLPDSRLGIGDQRV